VTKIVACSLFLALGLTLSGPAVAHAGTNPTQQTGHYDANKSMKKYQKQQKKNQKKMEKSQEKAQKAMKKRQTGH
jgi:hypothetical protein